MLTKGPEFDAGWAKTFDVHGVPVTVVAQHRPKPTRSALGYRDAGVVETYYAWRMQGGRQPGVEIRLEPSGTLHVPHMRDFPRDLEEAARTYAARYLNAAPPHDETAAARP